MYSFEEKIISLKRALSEFFQSDDFVLTEVPWGRINTNFYVLYWESKYFLRTSITKIKNDFTLWSDTDLEYYILTALWWTWISTEVIHYHSGEDISFLLLEMILGIEPWRFSEWQESIIQTLGLFQNQDISLFPFLKTCPLKTDFEVKIQERMKSNTDREIANILNTIWSKMSKLSETIQDDFCLCHNDFRADNILLSPDRERSWIIDIECCIIWDRYIDIAEYYVGGIFWNNFSDLSDFDFSDYCQFLNKYGYTDSNKQLYMYLLQYCSYLSWIAAYISLEQNPHALFKDTLERNRKKYYTDMEKFVNSL